MTKKIDRLTEIRTRLVADLERVGIDADLYSLAVDIAAETLLERERAYDAYVESGSTPVLEGKNNPYAMRLAQWNSQARACLSMLKLTPWRVLSNDPEGE